MSFRGLYGPLPGESSCRQLSKEFTGATCPFARTGMRSTVVPVAPDAVARVAPAAVGWLVLSVASAVVFPIERRIVFRAAPGIAHTLPDYLPDSGGDSEGDFLPDSGTE